MKFTKLSALVPALGFVALCSGDLFAAGATSFGNECVPLVGSFQYATNGIASGSDNNVAACPIAMGNQTLGTTVNFRASVYDNSTTAGYSCVGYVYDQNGGFLAATSTTKTTGVSATGSATFGLPGGTAWTATLPSANASTNVYVIQCTMPGNYSTLYTAHAR